MVDRSSGDDREDYEGFCMSSDSSAQSEHCQATIAHQHRHARYVAFIRLLTRAGGLGRFGQAVQHRLGAHIVARSRRPRREVELTAVRVFRWLAIPGVTIDVTEIYICSVEIDNKDPMQGGWLCALAAPQLLSLIPLSYSAKSRTFTCSV